MKLVSLVPVDRSNRDAAVASIREATKVLKTGLHMTVFPEGTRSSDGRMQAMKKGPFYLVEESGVPVVPVTVRGTFEMWPKHRFAMTPGPVILTYHPPITYAQAGSREALMKAVRNAIESGLPEDQRSSVADEDDI
jgi:1-acyl-sn-glycerol-3-phosphate acyltransferase